MVNHDETKEGGRFVFKLNGEEIISSLPLPRVVRIIGSKQAFATIFPNETKTVGEKTMAVNGAEKSATTLWLALKKPNRNNAGIDVCMYVNSHTSGDKEKLCFNFILSSAPSDNSEDGYIYQKLTRRSGVKGKIGRIVNDPTKVSMDPISKDDYEKAYIAKTRRPSYKKPDPRRQQVFYRRIKKPQPDEIQEAFIELIDAFTEEFVALCDQYQGEDKPTLIYSGINPIYFEKMDDNLVPKP